MRAVALDSVPAAPALAEYVTVSASHGVAHLPAGLEVADAGALGLAGTAALNSIDALALSEDETVLVSGATGGVGALVVQLAAARGARVIATARPGAEAGFVTGLTDAGVTLVDYTADLESQVRSTPRTAWTPWCTSRVTDPRWPDCCARTAGSPRHSASARTRSAATTSPCTP
jgi:NADPH:quinone reductase-like Zn-dependent oxidoreductase